MANFIRPSLRNTALAIAGAGALTYQGYRYYSSSTAFAQAHAESLPSDIKSGLKKMDWKGFVELKLENAEMYNHNVKKLTFALPDDQTVSGLPPISTMSGTYQGIKR
jgi:cytochrome-b5 reductase